MLFIQTPKLQSIHSPSPPSRSPPPLLFFHLLPWEKETSIYCSTYFMYSFIGCFLYYVSWPGIDTTTLVYPDDTLTWLGPAWLSQSSYLYSPGIPFGSLNYVYFSGTLCPWKLPSTLASWEFTWLVFFFWSVCAVTLVLPGILLDRQHINPMVIGESKGVCKCRERQWAERFSPVSLQFKICLGPHRNNLQRFAQTWDLPWGQITIFFLWI